MELLPQVAGPLIGGLLGGMSGGSAQGGTQTQTKEPWADAAPWLRQQIQTGQDLQGHYQRNPFNAQQQNAYGNLSAGTNTVNQLIPSLLGQMSNQPAFDRNNPTARQSSMSFNPSGQFGFGTQASGFQQNMNGAGNPFANGSIQAPTQQAAQGPAKTWRDSPYYNPEDEANAWIYDARGYK
jgi:hypothetical protein